MRSSIACIRCRRSKVKCVNNGVGTQCRSCENSGRTCEYPEPVAGGSTRRREVSPSGRADYPVQDGERRVRPRKSTHTFVPQPQASAKDGAGYSTGDVLDAKLLTPTVWQELFDIFQIHFSADLPFLHPPTFLKPLRHASAEAPESARPPAPSEFLMAFLALTARFHPKIVAHHNPTNPLVASEYYAAAAHNQMTLIWNSNSLSSPSLHFTQTFLMLGLHDWGMCRGLKAWVAIGFAIRTAQAMGLQYELDLDDEPMSRSMALRSVEAHRLGIDPNRKGRVVEENSSFIQQEIRRRTFWSCFIMDRYLSSGKYRPQMLHVQDLRIQLPASERSFLFGEKVKTKMLGEDEHLVNGRAEVRSQRQESVMLATGATPEQGVTPSEMDEDEDVRLETGADEGLVSRYVKILEIYGKVVRWSCAGGRRVEKHPPWHRKSHFYELRELCKEFKSSLPHQHRLTAQNTSAHISLKTSSPYTLVHTVYLLCQIVLHREYLPFIPLRCSKPEGPLDPPTFPKEGPDAAPAGFWEESARECFKAAREIMDLVRTCQEWGCLVETPIVGFAIYTVAFVGVCALHFPWMDVDSFMCTPPQTPTSRNGPGAEAAAKASDMLGQMRQRMHMAYGWTRTILKMHQYFKRMKKDYYRNAKGATDSDGVNSGGDSPESTRHRSLREGGEGGGLDEFKLLERTLKDFGTLEDQDVEMTDNLHDDSASTNTTVKSEEPPDSRPPEPPSQPRQDSGPWNAINHAVPGANSNRSNSISTPSNGQFRTYESYPQYQPPQNGQPPQTYQHQINNFRPAYPQQETPAPSNAPPSLTSPTSRTGSTPSQPSPPYDQHNYTWASKNMQQPMQPIPTSSYSHTSMHQPMQGAQSYPAIAPQIPAHQVWDSTAKEAWFNSIPTRMGGDDIAAFVDGGEMAEWAALANANGYGGGWLSTVWGDANGGH